MLLEKRSANYSHSLNPAQHLFFVNQVLVEHRHAHVFALCLGLCSLYKGGVEYKYLEQRLRGLPSPCCLLSDPLQKKVANSCSRRRPTQAGLEETWETGSKKGGITHGLGFE